MRLPGLDPARSYTVEVLHLPGEHARPGKSGPPWQDQPYVADGATLGSVGLAMAVHHPESATLLHLVAAPLELAR